jgi:hypothetical protein
VWDVFDKGETIGKAGSENGTIMRDEEHSLGARITIERDAESAPFAITCGIDGWMVHTRFFSSEAEATEQFESMKTALAQILTIIPLSNDAALVDTKMRDVSGALAEFIDQYP